MGLGTIRGKRVALAKPQTFMNVSGRAVKGLLERYELKPDRLIVVYDELDLAVGRRCGSGRRVRRRDTTG